MIIIIIAWFYYTEFQLFYIILHSKQEVKHVPPLMPVLFPADSLLLIEKTTDWLAMLFLSVT